MRNEIKRLKRLDLEFANEALTGAGEAVDASALKALRKQARVEAAEAFRKGRSRKLGFKGVRVRAPQYSFGVE